MDQRIILLERNSRKLAQTTANNMYSHRYWSIVSTFRHSTFLNWSILIGVAATFSFSSVAFARRLYPHHWSLKTFARLIMRLSNNLSLCLWPLFFINCVKTWMRFRETNSHLSDRLSIKIHSYALMAAPYTLRIGHSSTSYVFTARLEGSHNKTLPEARSWNLLSSRSRIRWSFGSTTIQRSWHPSRVTINQL